jgi:hypothetical protein
MRAAGVDPNDEGSAHNTTPYAFELYELTLTVDALQALVSYRHHVLTAGMLSSDQAVAGWREESRSYAAEFATMCWALFAEQHPDEAKRLEQGGIE